MNITEILGRFHGVQHSGTDAWKAQCPAHDDTNASLCISVKQGKVLVHCQAGCATETVLSAVHLEMKDLFLEPGRQYHAANFAYGCTLAQYAQAKCLDPKKLESFGVTDGERVSSKGRKSQGVRMPYWDSKNAMEPCGIRWRMRMQKERGSEPSRFLWERDSRLCLYGLWRQDASSREVILVEGESDCHSLWSVDYIDADGQRCRFNALGLPGSNNYKPVRDDPQLRFYDTIYVHIEKDTGGHTLYTRLAGLDERRTPSSLLPKIKFFSLAGYKDPSDAWVKMHTTSKPREEQDREFYQFVHRAVLTAQDASHFLRPAEWKELEEKQQEIQKNATKTQRQANASAGGKVGRPATDYVGLIRAFRRTRWTTSAGDLLTLRYWRNSWYAYDGMCYKQMPDSDMENEAMSFLLDPMVGDAYHVQPSSNALRSLLLGLRSTSNCGISSVAEMPMWLSSGQMATGWHAMSNCLVDIETAAARHFQAATQNRKVGREEAREFTMPLTPDLLSTFAMEYPYDPEAECPRFLAWLRSTQPSPDIQAVVQMMLGLMLVPDTSYNVSFFCTGEGGTGKSTYLDIMRALVCDRNVCRLPLLKFEDKFSLWKLAECLVNIVGEMPTEDPQGKLRSIEGDFKDAVSGGMLVIEKKGKDITFAKCTARFVFGCNSLPVFFDKSEGIWDRLIIIPFEQRFRGSTSEIRDIKSTIIPMELPGIFNFALAGLGML
ncbi:MAG: hypothetical protein IJT83_15160, partial [Victivallales bacterium]|nr:hypothetical protein [Victivallales bacterium]